MKPLSRDSIFTLLFFFLFSSYVGATHIHHNALIEHSDCKVCVVAKGLHGDDVVLSALPFTPLFRTFELISSLIKAPFSMLYKGFNAHAPPA